MKTSTFLAVVLGVLLSSSSLMAMNNNSQGDDTIRIMTKDNSEMIIIINDISDIENLDAEIESVMNSLDQVMEDLDNNLDGLDTVINVSVRNVDNEIIVDVEGLQDNEAKTVNLNVDMDDEPKHDKKLTAYGSYDFGFNNYLEKGKFPNDVNAQYSVKPWGSWYFALGGGLRWYVVKPISLDLGVDFAWYTFKYQDRATRVFKNTVSNSVDFTQDLSGAEYNKSKTTVPYFNINLTPIVHFGKKTEGVNHTMFRIGAGVYAGYRLGGSVKYAWELNGVRSVEHHKGDYFLNSYRYGVKAVFGFNDFNLFATYDLSTLYADNRGPELNPICFGLNFTF